MLLLQFGWTMETYWSWMVWLNWSMSTQPPPSCQGPGSTLRTGGYLSTPPTCRSLRAGVCCALPSCAQGAWAEFPRGRGGISDAAIGMVVPLAGDLCVPRTGVRIDHPLGVAPPASLPCFSPLPHSVTLCLSTRAGAMDWGPSVENAAEA